MGLKLENIYMYSILVLLDDEETAYSTAGHHCITPIIKEPKKYHSLTLSLEDIKVEVESLSSRSGIIINN